MGFMHQLSERDASVACTLAAHENTESTDFWAPPFRVHWSGRLVIFRSILDD